jgi:hypothetical protein
MIINIGFGAFILKSEIDGSALFRMHVTSNVKVSSICIILAITDIEALSILSSKLAGFMCFHAPISPKTQKYIRWLSLLGLFVEDIPQLIIQGVYVSKVINYDIVPTLTLLITAVSILVKLCSQIIECICPVADENHHHDDDDDDDDDEIELTENPANTENTDNADNTDNTDNRSSVISIPSEEGATGSDVRASLSSSLRVRSP